MTRVTVVCGVLLLVVAGGVWAEQIGGPSGPADGQWKVGAEANFRDDLEGVVREVGGTGSEPVRLSTHAFYGVLQYGICDRLSVRAKAGVGKVGIDATGSVPVVTDDLADFGYGLAWSAGLQYRICAPDERGASLALSGQFARMKPDNFSLPGQDFTDAEFDEITAALTVGTTNGRTRPYAGIVWADRDFDLRVASDPWSFEQQRVGAVFGLDQTLCDTGWLNLEARVWGETSFAASAGLSW